MFPVHRVFLLLSLMFLSCVASVSAQDQAKVPLVLLISIDGLKPEAILQARAHHLLVPNLQRMVREGVYADGVIGVLPTLTYPSHTTILTGVSPAKHGIYANTTFDPLNRNEQGWYWYSEEIRVPTLWDAAHASGRVTANVYWPVSVGAHVDYNLAQIWRTGTADDLKLQRAVSTPGLIEQLEANHSVAGAPAISAMDTAPGHYPGGEEETVAEDEIRAQYAISLLHLHHPRFMTVYFTGLDTQQHRTGPFSPEADAVLERIDALIGEVRAAAESEAPHQAFTCVISDHGFAPVQHDVNLYEAFLAEGLITLDAVHKIAAWKAQIWPMGGSAAIVLADPEDAATKAKVDRLLARLAADPANGIEHILSRQQIAKDGGFPGADSIVSMSPGYELGYNFVPPLVTAGTNGGMHGYPPERPEMRSTFVLVGPGIGAGRSLGVIDMRRIAPTLATLMDVSLPDAELAPLVVK